MSTTAIAVDVDMARSPFSTAAFAQLVRRLRHTNARYNQIASQFRRRIRPTHHAKRRAYWAGLCIDTTKARALPDKYVSVIPPPVLDRSTTTTPSSVDLHANPTETDGQGNAYMRTASPQVVVRKHRRGVHRVILRVPPLKPPSALEAPFQGPVPGAPRLLPKQLPEDDSGVEEMMLASPPSFVDGPDPSLMPVDLRVPSGLCITIPPRPLKRKLEDMETDEDTTEHPKHILKVRFNESETQ